MKNKLYIKIKKPIFKNWYTFDQTTKYFSRKNNNKMEWEIFITKPWKLKKKDIKEDKSKFLRSIIQPTYNKNKSFIKPNKPFSYIYLKNLFKYKFNNLNILNKSNISIFKIKNTEYNNKDNKQNLLYMCGFYNTKFTLNSNNVLILLKLYLKK